MSNNLYLASFNKLIELPSLSLSASWPSLTLTDLPFPFLASPHLKINQ